MKKTALCNLMILAAAIALTPALRAAAPVQANPAEQNGVAASGFVADGNDTAAPVADASQNAAAPFSENVYAPRFEVFAGYTYLRAVPMDSTRNRLAWASGFGSSIAYNPNRVFGIVFDYGAYHATKFGPGAPPSGGVVNASGNIFTYMVGPRLAWRHPRWTPFAQLLVGAARADAVTLSNCTGTGCTPLATENSFASTAGVGLDLTLTRHVALRLFQVDYALTHFKDPTSPIGAKTWQNDARFSAGLVIRLGGGQAAAPVVAPPPPPMTMATCSATPGVIVAGSGDTVAVSMQAIHGGNAMTYSWQSSGGAVTGSGANVTWSAVGLAPGAYVIRGHVDNGHGGKADCSAPVRVDTRPLHPPTMTCSVDRAAMTVGQTARVTAIAASPDGDTLTYSWRVSGGQIVGDGPVATFDSTGVNAGAYTANGHVDDGRGGVADCSVAMTVATMEVISEPVVLEAALSLHSVYFPTDQPAADAADGGLTPSQRLTLRTLAVDFNAYLKLKPDAKLTLEGHADERASVDYNQALAERRVAAAKSFLVAQGVPAANLETHSFGKSDPLDEVQVRQQMKDNPDLTEAERQVLFANMHSVILAQNRRVDVMLNSSGQQSERRYPFNAKDALTLMSDKALAH